MSFTNLSRKHCCVVGCGNNYSNTAGLSMFAFPSEKRDLNRRQLWIQAVKRENNDGTPWIPTKHSKVCSDHFVGGSPVYHPDHPAYIPTLFLRGKKMCYKCEICKKDFESDETLAKHVTLMHEQRHTCTICEKTFSQSCLLEQHLISYSGKHHLSLDPLKCDVCCKKFSSLHLLKKHRRLHENKCDQCSKSFSDLRGLRRHQTIHVPKPLFLRSTEKDEQPTCEIFGKTYAQVDELMRHLSSHDRGMYVCYICNRHYTQTSVLDHHLRQHNKDKMQRCRCCHKKFLDSWVLNDHMRRCNRGETHLCKICFKSFPDIQQLSQHELEHMHSCNTCKKQFLTKEALDRHSCTRMIHRGLQRKCESSVERKKREQPTCKICRRTFTRVEDSMRHLSSHERGMYMCFICNRHFRLNSNLYSHLQQHNKDEMLQCQSCKKTFLDSWVLNSHMWRCKRGKTRWCKICLKSFPDSKQRSQHEFEHMHRCDTCNKQFLTKDALDRHSCMVHRGLQHKCESCQKTFWLEHRLAHTSAKPYRCNSCNGQFSLLNPSLSGPSSLWRVILRKCHLCDETFNSLDEFESHWRTHFLSSESNVCNNDGVQLSSFLQEVDENPPTACDVKLLLSFIDHLY